MKIKNLFSLPVLAAIISGSFLLGACTANRHTTANRREVPPQAQPQMNAINAAAEKRKALEAQYAAMPVPDLAKKLAEDSAGGDVEPFNSPAYREITKRQGAINENFLGFVKAPDRGSFFALLAVRKVNKDLYGKVPAGTKVSVLIGALKKSKNFNSWGLPHLYWEDAAKALIETGEPAIPGLKALLGDKREAPLWGSEEVGESKKYGYRVCDYALALILEIQKKKGDIPVKPEERDRVIDGLLKDSVKE